MRLVPVLVVVLLTASACGGESDSTTPAPTTTATSTTTAQATTTAAPTTTAQATTTAAPTTTAQATTTAAPTTTAQATTTVAPATTQTPTTTVAPATTQTPTTTVAPATTATPTTTTVAQPTVGGGWWPPETVKGCGGFLSQQEAQGWFDYYFDDLGDVSDLDINEDGIPCSEGVDECCPEAWGGWEAPAPSTGEAPAPSTGEAPAPSTGEAPAPSTAWLSADFSNGALPTAYPLPTGQPVGLEMLTAPEESDEELCRIPQLPGSWTGGEGYTAFPVVFDNLQPVQNVRVATIPIDWDDHEGDPANLPAKRKQVQIFMDYYETASQGALTFTPTFADRWYRLPESVSDYPQRQVSDFNPKLAQHGINAADDDLDFSQIDIVVFIFPNGAPIIAGIPPSPLEFATMQNFNNYDLSDERRVSSDEGFVRNYISGGMFFEHPLRPIWSYYFHEAAHMFAMPDWYMKEANAVLGSQQAFDIDYSIGPLNVWGVMSSQDGPSRTFVAWTRWLLGWLDDDQVDCYTIEQVQQHGSFDTELVALDIYEPGTKAIIIRTGEYSGFLIESRRPVFPDDYLAIWETVGRDPYGLIVYEIDATKPSAMGTLSVVTPDGHDFKNIWRHGRSEKKLVDALFNVGNTATVQGVEIELLFTGDRDWVRISK